MLFGQLSPVFIVKLPIGRKQVYGLGSATNKSRIRTLLAGGEQRSMNADAENIGEATWRRVKWISFLVFHFRSGSLWRQLKFTIEYYQHLHSTQSWQARSDLQINKLKFLNKILINKMSHMQTYLTLLTYFFYIHIQITDLTILNTEMYIV